MSSKLPPFPVDDSTLDLVWLALNPGEEAERTSLEELLILMSQMGGSDTDAVESTSTMLNPFNPESFVEMHVMRDQQYHSHDVIRALIVALRKERGVDV